MGTTIVSFDKAPVARYSQGVDKDKSTNVLQLELIFHRQEEEFVGIYLQRCYKIYKIKK